MYCLYIRKTKKKRDDMKKGMSIKKLASILQDEFAGKTFSSCTRRNGKPSYGWTICRKAGITRAIRMAGLPYNQYWSGSNPTPSTQAPTEIVNKAWDIAYE